MNKRIIALILLVLVLFTLVGCSQNAVQSNLELTQSDAAQGYPEETTGSSAEGSSIAPPAFPED